MFPQITSFFARFPHWSPLEWGGVALNLAILFFVGAHAVIWLGDHTQGLRANTASKLLAPCVAILLAVLGPRWALRLMYSGRHSYGLWRLRREMVRQLGKRGWHPTADSAGAIYHIIRGEWERCATIGEDAVGPLYAATQSYDGQEAARAIGALAQIAGPLATEVLVRNLANGHTDTLAAAALRARGWQPEDLDATVSYGIASRDAERCAALGPAAVPVLAQRLQQTYHDERRLTIVQALGKLGGEQALAALERLAYLPLVGLQVQAQREAGQILIAAGRACSCSKCRGTGYCLVPMGPTGDDYEDVEIMGTCPECFGSGIEPASK